MGKSQTAICVCMFLVMAMSIGVTINILDQRHRISTLETNVTRNRSLVQNELYNLEMNLCQHPVSTFKEEEENGEMVYYRVCRDCGKILELYKTQKRYLGARLQECSTDTFALAVLNSVIIHCSDKGDRDSTRISGIMPLVRDW